MIRFTGPDDSGAFQGEVFETTDPDSLDLGPVSLTPQAYDMALLEQGDFQSHTRGARSTTGVGARANAWLVQWQPTCTRGNSRL